MAKYVPSPRDWVREQVDLYESSGGTEGTTLRDTGLPVIIVTHTGNKTGAVRKTPLMRVRTAIATSSSARRNGIVRGPHLERHPRRSRFCRRSLQIFPSSFCRAKLGDFRGTGLHGCGKHAIHLSPSGTASPGKAFA